MGTRSMRGEREMQSHYLRKQTGRNWLLDPNDFQEKMAATEENHLLDFLAFIKNKRTRHNLNGWSTLLELIQGKSKAEDYNWRAFAHGYNGSGYATNGYHTRLESAYKKYKDNA